jgi:hypothetical protein
VRCETYLNGNPVPQYTREWRYFGRPAAVSLNGPPVKAGVLDIDTINIVSPKKPDQELRITCRLNRTVAGATEVLFNGTAYLLSIDLRPDEVKPYVRWANWVTYWNGYRKVKIIRRSKIHKAPGKGGCRFSNQYLRPACIHLNSSACGVSPGCPSR